MERRILVPDDGELVAVGVFLIPVPQKGFHFVHGHAEARTVLFHRFRLFHDRGLFGRREDGEGQCAQEERRNGENGKDLDNRAFFHEIYPPFICGPEGTVLAGPFCRSGLSFISWSRRTVPHGPSGPKRSQDHREENPVAQEPDLVRGEPDLDAAVSHADALQDRPFRFARRRQRQQQGQN